MSIWDLFDPSAGQTAARKSGAATQAGLQNAQEDVTKYGKRAIGTERQALPAWQDIFGQGQTISPLYFGASGAGSPQDIAAAQQAWQSSIPYQQFQNQLPDIYEAALRRGGLTGQTGQIPLDLNARAMQALNQFYPGWQSSLDPYKYLTAGATGQTGVYGDIANLQSGMGTNLANLSNQIGQAKAGTIANVFGAGSAADANQLSALFGLGNLLVSAIPGSSAGGQASTVNQASYNPNWPTTVNYG